MVKGGGARVKIAAMVAFKQINADAVASCGGVDVLIMAIDMPEGNKELVRASSTALVPLVKSEAGRAAIMSNGLATCVRLLEEPNPAIHLNALHVLQTLAQTSDGRTSLADAGAAAPLVQLARDSSDRVVRHEAIGILCRLAQQQEQLLTLIEAGTVPVLVAELASGPQCWPMGAGGAVGREEAAGALRQLSGAPGGPVALVDSSGVRTLVPLASGSTTPRTQAHAVHTVLNLAQCSETTSAVAREPTAIEASVTVIEQSEDAEVRAAAAATLACVAEAGSREEITSAGGVRALLSMLGREQAGELHSARALCSLGDHLGSHAALSAGVPQLVTLASQGGAEAKASAVATLHKLSTGGDETAAAAMAGSSEAVSLMVDQLSSEGAAQVTAASLRQLCTRADAGYAMKCIVEASGVGPLVVLRRRQPASGRLGVDIGVAVVCGVRRDRALAAAWRCCLAHLSRRTASLL